MKKTALLLLLLTCFIGVKAQTTYQLNYDSIRVGKTAGSSGVAIFGDAYLKTRARIANSLEVDTTSTLLVEKNGNFSRKGPSYIQFNNRNQIGSGLSRVTVGMLGHPEFNASFNMDYRLNGTGGVHKYFDPSLGATWLYASSRGWGVQYAVSGSNGSALDDIWVNTGQKLLIAQDSLGHTGLWGNSSTPWSNDATLYLNRNAGEASVVGHSDLVLEGHRTKGVAGDVFLNTYNHGDVYLARGGGRVFTGLSLSNNFKSYYITPTSSIYSGYDGGVDMVPSTVPGSAITANQYFRLKDTTSVGTTRHHLIVDGGGLFGLPVKYKTDQSSNYDTRSLIDKGYADGRYAGITSATANTIPKFNSDSTITNSTIEDNGSSVTVNNYLNVKVANPFIRLSNTTSGANDPIFYYTGGVAKLVDFNTSTKGLTIDMSTGTVTALNSLVAPTPSAGDNSTKVATTAYVDAATANITSGTYTPTISATSGIVSTTAYDARYHRIGDIVFVSGKISVVDASSSIGFDISLPVSSNFTSLLGDVSGVVTSTESSKGSIDADTTTDKAHLTLMGISAGLPDFVLHYQFSYVIK